MPRNPRPVRRPQTGSDRQAAQSVIDARSQKAWRAVRQFTQMLPSFTSFARMATGNNRITVRLGSQGAQTDGNTIWIFPPISLGEERIHQRSLCDRRGPDKRQQCSACDAREVSLFYLFHEIAHIAFESVVPPQRYLVDRIEGMIDDWHPAGVCHHASYMRNQLPLATHYMELGKVHNGFLPTIVNVLEDARVNAKMFRARPGLKIMFEAGTVRIFEHGRELSTGERQMWRDDKPNPQIMIGLFLLASGYAIEEGYLSEQVTESLRDSELVRIASRVVMANSAHQVMELSIEAFARLNELGYCLVPKCEPAPPVPPSAPSEPDDEEHDANQSDQDDGQAPPEPEGDDSGESGDDPGGSGESSGGSAGQPEDQSDAGEETDAGSADAEPESGAGGQHQDGAGGGQGDEDDSSDPDGDQADSSADDVNRGTGDIDEQTEGENGSGAESSTRGAGSDDERDDEDNDDSDSSSGAESTFEDGEPSSEGGDAEHRHQGEDSASPEADEKGDRPVSGESQDLDEADQFDEDWSDDSDEDWSDAEEDDEPEGESIWDDPTAAEAAADQYSTPGDDPAPTDYGSPDDVGDIVKQFGGHTEVDDFDADESGIDHQHFDEEDHSHEDQYSRQNRELMERKAVELATKQSSRFDNPSRGLAGLEVIQYPQPAIKWGTTAKRGVKPPSQRIAAYMPGEALMGEAVMRARLVFEANQRAKEQRNLKAGRVDGRVLGRRAPFGDPRIMSKRTIPGRRDYFYVIGVDCSGSTDWYERHHRIKRAVMAQATLLDRVGAKFAIYGFTGTEDIQHPMYHSYGTLDTIYVLDIKGPDEPWNELSQSKLADTRPIAGNYDGHNLEFLRKVCDSRTETVRGILYYTDGEMPAGNPDEEIVIINDEIATCRRKGYSLNAVGINTDSPRQYGLNTVQVDSDGDLNKVVEQLGRDLRTR